MDQQQPFRWWPTRTQVLWMGIAIVGLFAAIVVFGGYYFEWKWTGFPKRTPWDWVDLLIVPIVLALGGYLFTRSENRATREAADQRTQDEVLHLYLDQMGQMLLDKDRPLRRSKEEDERTLARAWTLTVLEALDASRRSRVVRFLYEALLLDYRPNNEEAVVSLAYANLSGCDLSSHSLPGIDLSKANLSEANLSEANLVGTDLSEANLSEATVSDKQLRSTKSLKDATMPNGQKYENWLKSKGRGGDGENPGPS